MKIELRSFVLGAAAAAVLATASGMQRGASDEERYLKACQALQGEYVVFRLELFDESFEIQDIDTKAASKRVNHWLKVIQEFRP